MSNRLLPTARLLLAAGVLMSLLIVAPAPAAAQTTAVSVPTDANVMPTKVFFPETGHNLEGTLLKAWRTTGLMIIGYPISEPVVEAGRTVQYFERAKLEVWPEHAGTQWEVQGTLLGNWMARNRRGEAPFMPLPSHTPSTESRVFFPETGHTLAFAFKEYWDANGGLWQFGYPISEEFQENGFTVQYFERARFEYHPENAGTPYAVLLGLLGKDYAASRQIKMAPTSQAADGVRYDVGLFENGWLNAFSPRAGVRMAMVSDDAVGIRGVPDAAAEPIDIVYYKRPVEVRGIVRGKPTENGIDAWYVVGDNQYISAAYVDPLVLHTPPQYFDGHWVDVNLTQFYATAYNGSTPVYVAIIAAGRDGRTPLGTYNIMFQVRSETMDSATVGIPRGDPGYYYLENVEFTQYFLDGGYAIHGNYWTPESRFGNFTSNGCVGMMNQDAEFFWNWMNPGDVVNIHY